MKTEDAIKRVADAITPNVLPGRDAQGGAVESLTEAVMGVTSALSSIADAIRELADAVRESQTEPPGSSVK